MSEETRRGCPPYLPEIEWISAKLSINHETLRQWLRRAETDAVGQG